MRVIHLMEAEKLKVADLPAMREPTTGEAALEVLMVGICGSDVLRYRKGAPVIQGYRKPHIPGHEVVARVTAIGRAVESRLLGRKVIVDPSSPCLRCDQCIDGSHHLCMKSRFLGEPPTSGAMAERLIWPSYLCHPVPEQIPNEVAMLIEPVSVAIHAVDLADPHLMENMAVLGCGPLGLIVIKVLRAAGVGNLLAVDPVPYRRQMAIEHGATQSADPYEARDVVRHWPRQGADAVFDVTNVSTASREAVQLVRRGGRVIIAGVPDDDRVLFSSTEAHAKELAIRFVHHSHRTLKRALQMVTEGHLTRLEELVTHRFPLDEAAEAFRLVRSVKDNVLKCAIEFSTGEPAGIPPSSIPSMDGETED